LAKNILVYIFIQETATKPETSCFNNWVSRARLVYESLSITNSRECGNRVRYLHLITFQNVTTNQRKASVKLTSTRKSDRRYQQQK